MTGRCIPTRFTGQPTHLQTESFSLSKPESESILHLCVIEYATIANSEHADTDNKGQFSPTEFDMKPFEVDMESREMLMDKLSRDFGFIEVHYMGCHRRSPDLSRVRDFANAFNAEGRK